MAKTKRKKKSNIWAWVAGILGAAIVATGVCYATIPTFKDYVNTNILKIEQTVEDDQVADEDTNVDVEVEGETTEDAGTDAEA